MAINVTNQHRVSDADYKAQIEEKINKFFSTHTGKYEHIEFAIRSNAYHNNGSTIYPISVCRSLVPELKKAGFYCYWTRPSWAYNDWMDFCVSNHIRTSTQGNVQEL